MVVVYKSRQPFDHIFPIERAQGQAFSKNHSTSVFYLLTTKFAQFAPQNNGINEKKNHFPNSAHSGHENRIITVADFLITDDLELWPC